MSLVVKNNSFSDKICVWSRPEQFERIKDWEISYIKRTNYFFVSGYCQFKFETKSGIFGYIRFSQGLFLLATNERYLSLNHAPFETIGIVCPYPKKFKNRIDIEDLRAIFGWKIDGKDIDDFD